MVNLLRTTVVRAILLTDGGESNGQGSALSDFAEDLGLAVLGNVIRHLKVSKST